jgi:hypothetical protein
MRLLLLLALAGCSSSLERDWTRCVEMHEGRCIAYEIGRLGVEPIKK